MGLGKRQQPPSHQKSVVWTQDGDLCSALIVSDFAKDEWEG